MVGQKFMIVDSEDEVNEEATQLLEKAWFLKVMNYFMESKFWGYNLIQFDHLENFEFGFCETFPKQNVEPRTQKIRAEHNMINGIPFNEEPFDNWTFFVGDPQDLGLLNKAAPLTIWKKDALGSWADFAIMFGVPPRIGKTNTRDSKARKNMEDALKSMGKLFYSVMDVNDQIQSQFFCPRVSELDHLAELPGGVHMEQREWRCGRVESLHGQVQHHRGVFTDGIQHHRILSFRHHLPHDVDTFGFQPFEVSEVSAQGQVLRSIGAVRTGRH